MKSMIDKSIQVLRECLESDDEEVRYRAAIEILRRAGDLTDLTRRNS